jgi:hypothetical protein
MFTQINTSDDREIQRYSEDTESLLSQSDLKEESLNWARRWSSLRLTTVLIGTHVLVALLVAWLSSAWKGDLNSVCARHTSNYCKL